MDLRDAIRTTFACRAFTDEPVSNALLYEILDTARFAPSGGNRQGWRVVAVRDAAVRARFAELATPVMRRYVAERARGESPYNTIVPSGVDDEAVAETELPDGLLAPITQAPVLLLVGVDLKVVASFDEELDRVGVISGASIYPFVWNVLLTARARGLAGVLTTYLAPPEAEVRQLVGWPDEVAVAAAVPIGYPVKALTKLRRFPVEDFARLERWDGPPLEPGR